MKSCLSLLLPLVAGIFLLSCADHPAKPAKTAVKPDAAEPKLVGRIASIPADRRFVLIQSYGKWEVESGAILTTRGPEERSANLRATGEKLGEFAAADVQSGVLEKGDAVYSRHIPKPVEAPATSPPTAPIPSQLPENQVNAPLENVQKNN